MPNHLTIRLRFSLTRLAVMAKFRRRPVTDIQSHWPGGSLVPRRDVQSRHNEQAFQHGVGLEALPVGHMSVRSRLSDLVLPHDPSSCDAININEVEKCLRL